MITIKRVVSSRRLRIGINKYATIVFLLSCLGITIGCIYFPEYDLLLLVLFATLALSALCLIETKADLRDEKLDSKFNPETGVMDCMCLDKNSFAIRRTIIFGNIHSVCNDNGIILIDFFNPIKKSRDKIEIDYCTNVEDVCRGFEKLIRT